MANKFKAEVDAPEFGPGFTIRLDMDGQARLEGEFGEFDFAHKVQLGLAVLSAKYIRAFLAAALRRDGDVVNELPSIPAPLDVVGKQCLDAFSLFRYGKDSEAWAAENEAKKPAKAPTANPTKGTKA